MGCSSSKSSRPNINDFTLYDKIGEGGFATIHRSLHKPSNSMFAVKMIDIHNCCSRKGGSDMLKTELEALKNLSPHPFIAKLHYAFHNYFSCYLVFELLEGGDLRYYLNTEYRFTEKMVSFFGGCIGSALHHIHSHNTLHRDIKPENIIFDTRGFPKLIDFGISYVCPDETMICTNCSGTRLYSAPELFTPSHAHGAAADFWALGLVLYEMLYLAHPFHHHCPREFMKFAAKYSLFCKNYHLSKSSNRSTQFSNTITSRNKNIVLWTDDGQNMGEIPSSQQHSPTSSLPLPQPHPHHLPHQQHQSPPSSSSQRKVIGGGVDEPQHLAETENTYKSQTGGGPHETSEFDEFDALILPSHLRVPLPQTSGYGEPISMACYEFLDELLDIRFDRRLGANEERYADFVRHNWLLANGIHVPTLVSSSSTYSSLQSSTTTHLSQPTHYSPTPPASIHSSAAVLTTSSPIKLNHEALKFYFLKRQENSNLLQSIKNNSKKNEGFQQQHASIKSYLIGLHKPHMVLPNDYPPHVLDILDSYQYSSCFCSSSPAALNH